jgi:hypothetical protein
MGISPTPNMPPLPAGLRAQQGPLPTAQPAQPPQDTPQALILSIGEQMRKLAQVLSQAKPEALPVLKQAVAAMAELLSQVQTGPAPQPMVPPPAPTPGEPPPGPGASAAPSGGYIPGG